MDQIEDLQHELQNKETIIKFQYDEIERLEKQCKENWQNMKQAQEELADLQTLAANVGRLEK